MATKNKSNEIKITRLYDAPVSLVWDAWTDPEQVAKWWGPRGFTITTHSKELKPGGIWHYTMHGPDGTDYPNKTLYHEVEKHSRLVYDHGGYDERKPLFRVTVTFNEIKGKTKMEMSMTMESPEAVEQVLQIIKHAGGNSTWDRLGEHLIEKTTGNEVFIINRSFEAPVETLFEMFTNPKHVSQWLAPTGMSMEYLNVDIKKGGSAFYMMTDGKDLTMYGKVLYQEITKPHRIVYTQHFCDKDGNMSRHPHAPTWPATMLTTVTFAEEGSEKTRVTIQWEVHGEATAAEREMFNKSRGGMTMGWTGSFDKLEAYLEKI